MVSIDFGMEINRGKSLLADLDYFNLTERKVEADVWFRGVLDRLRSECDGVLLKKELEERLIEASNYRKKEDVFSALRTVYGYGGFNQRVTDDVENFCGKINGICEILEKITLGEDPD